MHQSHSLVYTQMSETLVSTQGSAHSSFIHNCQNMEATKTPLSRWWINELQNIQTKEYSSTLKRNELSSHEKAQRTLKLILSERSQIWKDYMAVASWLEWTQGCQGCYEIYGIFIDFLKKSWSSHCGAMESAASWECWNSYFITSTVG